MRDLVEWDRPNIMPRMIAWYTDFGCRCAYDYGHHIVDQQDTPDCMFELMKEITPLCNISDPKEWPNSCNFELIHRCTPIGELAFR